MPKVKYSSDMTDDKLIEELLEHLGDAKRIAGWKKDDSKLQGAYRLVWDKTALPTRDKSKLQGVSGKHIVPLGRMKVQFQQQI